MDKLFLKKRDNNSIMIFVFLMLFSISQVALGEKLYLRVLHFNDFHGHILPFEHNGEKFGGGATLVQLAKDRKEGAKRCLVLDAGDRISGSSEVNPFYGKPAVELLNAMPIDATTTGNHEFDFGKVIFARRMADSRSPYYAANVYLDGKLMMEPYKIFDLSGLKVAVFGLATPYTAEVTNPMMIRGVVFEDPVECARILVPQLRKKADIVIALTHIGIEEDKILAQKVEGIDLIVGGHSHTFVENGLRVGDTLIAQAGLWGAWLGEVNMVFDSESKKIISAEAKLNPNYAHLKKDPEAQKVVSGLERIIDKIFGEKVGHAAHDLATAQSLRTGEHSLGNWVCDAVLQATKAEAVIFNSGSMRSPIKAGEITVRTLHDTMPFNDTVTVVSATGQQLKDSLIHGLNEPGKGKFSQVGGIRLEATLKDGNITFEKLLVAGEPLDLNRVYRVALNGFMASGGDGYTILAEAERQANPVAGKSIVNILKSWMLKNQVIEAEIDGRIVLNRQN